MNPHQRGTLPTGAMLALFGNLVGWRQPWAGVRWHGPKMGKLRHGESEIQPSSPEGKRQRLVCLSAAFPGTCQKEVIFRFLTASGV